MNKKVFFVGVLMVFFGVASAQVTKSVGNKKKPEPEVRGWEVLVVGNSNAAFAAAMQSAISGVRTTILLEAGGFDFESQAGNVTSGIQDKFLKSYKNLLKINDDAQPSSIDKIQANASVKNWMDSTKNLTVLKNVMWTKASRSGQHWVFKLSDGKTIRPGVLINVGNEKLNRALEITVATANPWNKLDYGNTIYRTSVASGANAGGTTATLFSLYQLFVPQQENFIWIDNSTSMSIGQSAGATAAYAAFFTVKTSQSSLKKIQGELINFRLNLLPFSDIKPTDTNWKSIQFVGVTGILKADLEATSARFSPEKLITTDEVKQPIKDFFYKAQIWFDDYKDSKMTIGATLDMVCYVGNKAVESTKKELAKKWKTNYQFKTEFDLSRQINRREFAVILHDYMPPFNVNVDDNGRVVR